MEYVIMGGDERFACLARLMKRRGMQVCTALRGAVPEVPSVPAEAIGSARSVIVNLPPKVLNQHLVSHVRILIDYQMALKKFNASVFSYLVKHLNGNLTHMAKCKVTIKFLLIIPLL